MTKKIRRFILLFLFAQFWVSNGGLCAETVCSNLSEANDPPLIQFDSRVDEVIRKHSIWALARELEMKRIVLKFIYTKLEFRDGCPPGYVIQNRMVSELLGRIFRPHPGDRRDVFILSNDSGLNEDGDVLQAGGSLFNLEMMWTKAGNPQVFTLSREEARDRYGISKNSRVWSIYGDFRSVGGGNIRILDQMFSRAKEFPDVILFSPRNLSYEEVKQEAKSRYRVLMLSDLEVNQKLLEQGWGLPLYRRWFWSTKEKILIYNDTVGRMPELYRASNFAMVVGANNFFEPLVAGCPTLILRSISNGFTYNPLVYERMKKTALATQGVVAVDSPEKGGEGIARLLEIPRNQVPHPAFVIAPGESKAALEVLLDRLEAMIRGQIRDVFRN